MNRYARVLSIALINLAMLSFSQAVISAKCGDESPSLREGIDPRTSITPTELDQDQLSKLITIFQHLKGEWKGTADVSECIAQQGKDVMRKEMNSIELTVELTDQNSIEMEFEIRSPEKRTRKNVSEKLFIDQNYLFFNDGPFNFKASVLHSRDNFISYLRKTKIPGKGNIPIEIVRSLAIYSKDSLMIEDTSYVNGMLSSRTVYDLK